MASRTGKGILARRLLSRYAGVHLMRFFNTRTFWDKKMKIAILTLATFIAMC
jgi:hypothetical protein